MIEFKNTICPSPEQWLVTIKGMRNPMNSWSKMDSFMFDSVNLSIGEDDYKLMRQLINAGSEHCKFLRMLPVLVEVTAPLYWWKEFDTYKVGTTANSCSTMHKITAKEFELKDFSIDHMTETSVATLTTTINTLNHFRLRYLNTKDKEDWWQLIQLLPTSYNQKRTLFLNYAVLLNIYHQRYNHKLDEWKEFCNWIAGLPYAELLTIKRAEGF